MFDNERVLSASIFVVVLCLIGRRKQIFRACSCYGSFNFRLCAVIVRPPVRVPYKVSNDRGGESFRDLSNVYFCAYSFIFFCGGKVRSYFRVRFAAAFCSNVPRVFGRAQRLIYASIKVNVYRSKNANTVLTRCVRGFIRVPSLFTSNVRFTI